MEKIATRIDLILARKYLFAATFFCVFSLTYGVLFILDWVPEPRSEAAFKSETAELNPDSDTEPESPRDEPMMSDPTDPLPRTLFIDALNREVPVLNPTSRSIADLDAALLDGLVRHPDSASFVQEGNIFILGHSSYLPNVFNQNFQALNGVQNLAWGDTIRVHSLDKEYVYRVDKVYQAKAADVTVPIADTGPRLTLATCNSFGATDDRYIVEAVLIDERTL